MKTVDINLDELDDSPVEDFEMNPFEDLKNAGIDQKDIVHYANRAEKTLSPSTCKNEEGRVDFNIAIKILDEIQDKELRSFILISAFATMFSAGQVISRTFEEAREEGKEKITLPVIN